MRCIVCGSPFLKEITRLERIPSSAQYFVPETSLKDPTLNASSSLAAYQCASCSHVQSQTSLVPYYKDVITASSLSPLILDKRDAVLRYICSLLGTANPVVLEIGAFQGQYLHHLKNHGYSNLFGLEHNLESVQLGRSKGLNLLQGYILDEPTSFNGLPQADLILCFNFLEHIPYPFQFLQTIKHRLCAETAYIYMTMPSFEYIRKTNLLQEFIPDHLSYFTLKSLQTLFARCNLDILSIEEINNSNDLEIVAKSTSVQPLSLDRRPFLALIHKINAVLSESQATNKRVAFWGAGHRSLTLISQLHHQFIDCIVDSASFKQGLSCPDTCLPVISPEDFFCQPSDVLFISLPGIYAEEVSSYIKQSNLSIEHIYVITGNDLFPNNYSAIGSPSRTSKNL